MLSLLVSMIKYVYVCEREREIENHPGIYRYGTFFPGIIQCQKQDPDYLSVMSLEESLIVHATSSSQSYNELHRRFQCPKCNNSYKYLGDMKKHLRFQCGQEPKFQCPYCRKRAKVSSNMYSHVRSMHRDQPMYIINLSK